MLGLAAGMLLLIGAVGVMALAQGLPTQAGQQEAPELRFTDAQGDEVAFADFRGRAVLLNIWATWCVPCREEMPALDRLQAKLGGPDFQVVALSIDRGGIEPVSDFYAEIGIENLDIYLDRSSAAMRALGVVGIPTTLLIDGEGRELQRWVGPAEWDSPEIVALIKGHLKSPA